MAPDSTPTAVAALLVAGLGLLALARQPGEVARAAPPSSQQHQAQEQARHQRPVASAAGTRALGGGGALDLNRATAGDLQLLPGIGPGLAQRILADREARGNFTSVEALRRVRGIGDKTLAALRPMLAVNPDSHLIAVESRTKRDPATAD